MSDSIPYSQTNLCRAIKAFNRLDPSDLTDIEWCNLALLFEAMSRGIGGRHPYMFGHRDMAIMDEAFKRIATECPDIDEKTVWRVLYALYTS